jgi:hypothetical protein
MGGGGGGGGMTMFGFRGGGVGLTGKFYDFKRNESGKSTGVVALDRPTYTAILRGFTGSSQWGPPSRFRHHTSKTALGAKAFFFPAMPDTEAGKAFQDPDAGAAMWLAHYSGSVTPSEGGEFRFVGWGDNVLIAGINGKLVLDASDVGYLKPQRTVVGQATFPGNGGKPIFEGEWFEVHSGIAIKLDVLVGDEGGVFTAGLFLQKKGQPLQFGNLGIPKLPLVLMGTLAENEKALFLKFLDSAAFSGPVFNARNGGSLFNTLGR